MSVCEVCGDEFDNDHGKNIHRSQVHGVPTRECEYCGSDFEIPPDNKDKKFCSFDCFNESGRIDTTCDTCGKEITVRKSRFERHNRIFCSTNCVNFSGENNPFYGETHENLHEKMPSGEDHWMYGRDRPEHSRKMSEIHSGENNPMHGRDGKDAPMFGVNGEDHPSWKGGENRENGYYYYKWRSSKKWKKARQKSLRRDDHQCQECGKGDEIHVHHIEPVSEGGDKFSLDNLVTLCADHHYERHRT